MPKDTEAKIEEGELAVRLTSDIAGGCGDHPKGTVLRHLSPSAFNTLKNGGLATALKAGASATDAVDASAPSASDDGSGTEAGGGASA